MFGTILSIIGSFFDVFKQVTSYLAKKEIENTIKNAYEKDKMIDALKEDKAAKELIEKNKNNNEVIKEQVKKVSETKSGQDEKLDTIVTKKVEEVKNDIDFNNGNEIVFKG